MTELAIFLAGFATACTFYVIVNAVKDAIHERKRNWMEEDGE